MSFISEKLEKCIKIQIDPESLDLEYKHIPREFHPYLDCLKSFCNTILALDEDGRECFVDYVKNQNTAAAYLMFSQREIVHEEKLQEVIKNLFPVFHRNL